MIFVRVVFWTYVTQVDGMGESGRKHQLREVTPPQTLQLATTYTFQGYRGEYQRCQGFVFAVHVADTQQNLSLSFYSMKKKQTQGELK